MQIINKDINTDFLIFVTVLQKNMHVEERMRYRCFSDRPLLPDQQK